EQMPLEWSRAFGGRAVPSDSFTDHPLNPRGQGYCLSAAEALGRPLPNLEDRAALITGWDDRPAPVCWAPITNARVWQAMDMPVDEVASDPEQELFSGASPPRMVLPAAPPAGCPVTITGTGPVAVQFAVPAVS